MRESALPEFRHPVPHPARRLPRIGGALLLALGLAASGNAALADPAPVSRLGPAAESGSFSPAQRAEIVAIVRQALKTDPTILTDAITTLRATAQQKEDADAGAALQANRPALAGLPGDAILGNPGGNVTLVEFYDPRCPYCRKVLPTIDTLVGSDRQVRVVEKLIPILGPNSVIDAQAIQAATAQGKYKALQQALMGDSGAPGLDRVRTLAAAIGMDVPRLLRDMKSPEVGAVLDRNVQLARTLHLTGTPTFVVGDQMIPGAVELADLRQAVAAQRGSR